jgi:hypothetical protein
MYFSAKQNILQGFLANRFNNFVLLTLCGLLGFAVYIFSLFFHSAPAQSVASITAASKNYFWTSYVLAQEGNYILKIDSNNQEKLLQNLEVFIPADDVLAGEIPAQKNASQTSGYVYLPSEGSSLKPIPILELLKAEGLNLTLKGKSQVYLVSKNSQANLPQLLVYRVGALEEYPKYKEGSK